MKRQKETPKKITQGEAYDIILNRIPVGCFTFRRALSGRESTTARAMRGPRISQHGKCALRGLRTDRTRGKALDNLCNVLIVGV